MRRHRLEFTASPLRAKMMEERAPSRPIFQPLLFVLSLWFRFREDLLKTRIFS
jgi:hypothetical protein